MKTDFTLILLSFLMWINFPFSPVKSEVINPENRNWEQFIQEEETNSGMKIQADKAIKILDDRIKEVINQVNKSLDNEAQILLRESQTKWLDYAQKKCEFIADKYRGGTHQSLAYGYCFIQEQVDRIEELIALNSN